MVDQRRRDTAPELAIRRLLHARGHRFRVDYPLPSSRRRANLVFTKRKVALFVDGFFWHACPIHRSIPKQNRTRWVEKLRANTVRDRNTDEMLREAGWQVVRILEHEDPGEAADRIESILSDLRDGSGPKKTY